MNADVVMRPSPPILSLAVRREALLARIQSKRQETAEAGHLLGNDLQAAKRSWRSMQAGLTVLATCMVGVGVLWSFKAASGVSRSRRMLTVIVSFASTVRAMRAVSNILNSIASPTKTNGYPS